MTRNKSRSSGTILPVGYYELQIMIALSPRLQTKAKKNTAKYRASAKQNWREWETFEKAIAHASELQILTWNSFEEFRLAIANHKTYEHMRVWLEALFTGEDSRYLQAIAGEDTLVLAPRESAKSTFLAQFVAYQIGLHTSPWIRIALKVLGISYNIETALPRSRQIQSIIQSPIYQKIFPWVRPSKQKWGEKEWMIDLAWAGLSTTEEQYTYVCGGLNGGLNSRRCLVGDTMVLTEIGQIPIRDLENHIGIKILTFNEYTQKPEWGSLKATASRQAFGILEVTTSGGHKVRCTPDHLFFAVGRGYTQAQNLVHGDSVVVATNPEILSQLRYPSQKIKQISHLRRLLSPDEANRIPNTVRQLRGYLHNVRATVPEKVCQCPIVKILLQSRMRGKGSSQTALLQGLRGADIIRKVSKSSDIVRPLCDEKQAIAEKTPSSSVRVVWKRIFSAFSTYSLLLSNLLKQSALTKNVWHWQQPLQTRGKLQQGIFSAKRQSNREGRTRLRCVPQEGNLQVNQATRETIKPHSASYQSRFSRRSPRESNNFVQELSYYAPQDCCGWKADTISSIEFLNIEEKVYDIEVEGNHNFFGNQILVHNCHLTFLDDLIKSPESIRAQSVRDAMESTWRSVVQFCRYDGSRAICLGTQMAANDIYCTEFTEEKKWRVIRQSALLEKPDGTEYSYWEPEDDKSPGTPLTRLQREREEMPVEFAFQRQNKIIRVKEQSINPGLIQRGVIPSRFDSLVLGCDLSAGKKESNDYTTMVLGGLVRGAGSTPDQYWIIDAWEDRIMGNIEKLDAMIEIWEMWNHLLPTAKIYNHETLEWSDRPEQGLKLFFDSSAYGLSLQGDYEDYIIGQKKITDWHAHPVPASGRGDKLYRLRKHTGLFTNKLVYFNLYGRTMPDGRKPMGRLIQQITEFGSTSHDDLADGFELCMTGLRSYLPMSKGNY